MHNSRNTWQRRVRPATRVLFAVYFFLYFYSSQDAALTIAQHYLSGGQTAYDPFVGSLVLTTLLLALQHFVARATHTATTHYPLTFLPSAAIAAMLTALLPTARWGTLVVALLALGAWVYIQIATRPRHTSAGYASQADTAMSTPLVLAAALMFCTGALGHCNEILRYEVDAANALERADYAEALKPGKRSLATSPRLQALRAYAMSQRESGLGNTLFSMPVDSGGSATLFLHTSDTLYTRFPIDSLALLESVQQQATTRPSRLVFRHPRKADYRLCALLLDKQLEVFARELPRYYVVSDSTILPRYYEQALVLYERLSTDPVVQYANPNVTANYLDFKDRDRTLPATQRAALLRSDYGDTYWWYYFFTGKPAPPLPSVADHKALFAAEKQKKAKATQKTTKKTAKKNSKNKTKH